MSEPLDGGLSDARPGWLFAGLFLLTAVTGVVDATSFLGLGQVFTANMTGNVLLLGFALSSSAAAHRYGLSAVGGLVSLAAFVAGALLGGMAAGRRGAPPRYVAALMMEWSALVAATVVVGLAPHPATGARLAVVGLLALAMGIQNGVVRRMGLPDVNTTVLTTALGGLAADVVAVGGRPARTGRRVATVGLIFLGAFVGALIERYGLVWSSLCALVVTSAAVVALVRAGVRGARA